jgi:hypothetical protein
MCNAWSCFVADSGFCSENARLWNALDRWSCFRIALKTARQVFYGYRGSILNDLLKSSYEREKQGFALVSRKGQGIFWWTIFKIVLSWFISPILAGISAVVLYVGLKFLILSRGTGCSILRPHWLFLTDFKYFQHAILGLSI